MIDLIKHEKHLLQISGIDWLEFSLAEFFPSSIKNLYEYANNNNWNVTEKIGRNFKQILVVKYYDQELFTVATGNYLNPAISTIKFSNELLYSPGQLVSLCNSFLTVCACRIRGITRLDIFTDSKGIDIGAKYAMLKRIKGGSTITPVVKRRQINQITIGSKSSEKYFKLYNKSLELKANHKPYIESLHEKTIGKEGIWRLEVTLKSKCLSSFRSFRSSIDTDFLHSLVLFGLSVKKSYLVTSIGEQIFSYYYKGLQAVKFFTKKIVKTAFSVKVAIKTFVYESMANGRFSINDLVIKYGLSAWLDKKYPYWYKDFNERFIVQKQLCSSSI